MRVGVAVSAVELRAPVLAGGGGGWAVRGGTRDGRGFGYGKRASAPHRALFGMPLWGACIWHGWLSTWAWF